MTRVLSHHGQVPKLRSLQVDDQGNVHLHTPGGTFDHVQLNGDGRCLVVTASGQVFHVAVPEAALTQARLLGQLKPVTRLDESDVR